MKKNVLFIIKQYELVNFNLFQSKIFNLIVFLRGKSKVIIQSSECTSTDIETKTQCFKEIPKEKYEALVNDTVVMRCIVENQHGRVQWRAQKMTMG